MKEVKNLKYSKTALRREHKRSSFPNATGKALLDKRICFSLKSADNPYKNYFPTAQTGPIGLLKWPSSRNIGVLQQLTRFKALHIFFSANAFFLTWSLLLSSAKSTRSRFSSSKLSEDWFCSSPSARSTLKTLHYSILLKVQEQELLGKKNVKIRWVSPPLYNWKRKLIVHPELFDLKIKSGEFPMQKTK